MTNLKDKEKMKEILIKDAYISQNPRRSIKTQVLESDLGIVPEPKPKLSEAVTQVSEPDLGILKP